MSDRTRTLTVSSWTEQGHRVFGLTWDGETVPSTVVTRGLAGTRKTEDVRANAHEIAVLEARDEIYYADEPTLVTVTWDDTTQEVFGPTAELLDARAEQAFESRYGTKQAPIADND